MALELARRRKYPRKSCEWKPELCGFKAGKEMVVGGSVVRDRRRQFQPSGWQEAW